MRRLNESGIVGIITEKESFLYRGEGYGFNYLRIVLLLETTCILESICGVTRLSSTLMKVWSPLAPIHVTRFPKLGPRPLWGEWFYSRVKLCTERIYNY